MGTADFIALGIIFFLLFCAVRYMLTHKDGGCCGNCEQCRSGCKNKKSDDDKKG